LFYKTRKRKQKEKLKTRDKSVVKKERNRNEKTTFPSRGKEGKPKEGSSIERKGITSEQK